MRSVGSEIALPLDKRGAARGRVQPIGFTTRKLAASRALLELSASGVQTCFFLPVGSPVAARTPSQVQRVASHPHDKSKREDEEKIEDDHQDSGLDHPNRACDLLPSLPGSPQETERLRG